MVKKIIFLFLLLGMFFISFASAADWDNVYNYNEETKTATVENWLGFGADLAYITLTSPQNVKVAMGEDRLVGQFNFTTTGDFIDTFGDIYLTDLKNGNSISRGKQFKYKKYIDVKVDDYETVCEDVEIGNGTIEECFRVEVGNHWEVQMDWIPINNPNEIFYDGITYEIGIFVDVELDDYGDWVPSIMGVEVEEWATWTADLNVGLSGYWNLNEQDTSGTGTIFDSLFLHNGTNAGGDNTTGKINTAYGFVVGNTDWIVVDGITTSTDMTFGFWANEADWSTGSHATALSFGDGTDTADRGIQIKSDLVTGKAQFLIWDAGGAATIESSFALTNGEWYYFTGTKEGTNYSLYINGTYVGSQTKTINTFSSPKLYMGALFSSAEHITGTIDEVGIWNRSLSQEELVQLYNNNLGITWTDSFEAITISLNSPETNAATTNQTIIFNTTINTTSLEVVNVSLLIDGVVNETNTSTVVGDYIFQKDLSFGNHNWSIRVGDNESGVTDSATRTLSIIDVSDSSVWTSEYQVRIIAGSLTDSDFEINNVTITQEGDNLWKVNTTESDYEISRAQVMKTFFYGSDGTDPRINRTTGLLKIQSIDDRDNDRRGIYANIVKAASIQGDYSCTFANTTSNFDVSSWSSVASTEGGNAAWEIPTSTARNTGTVNEIGKDTSADENNNPANCQIDTGSGSTGATKSEAIILSVGAVTWVEGGAGSTSVSNIDFVANESIPVISPMPNITLNSPEDNIAELFGEPIIFNITSTINGGGLDEIILYIDGIPNETKSLSGTEDTETFTKILPDLGSYNWSVEVCDTNNNCALSDTREILILPFTVVEYTYDTSITEGESNIISVEILVNEGSSLSNSILNYDSINYSTSVIFSNNTYIVASNIDAPLVAADTNISFNFFLTVDSVAYELQSLEQEVLNLDFDICGGFSNDTLLNMSLFDEELLTNITGTIEVNANIISKSSEESISTVNATFTDVNYGAICFSPVDSYDLYYINTEIRYFADGYVTELYYIQKADLAEYPKNLSLYSLNQNDSTEFAVTYKNNAFIFTKDAVIQLQRKYVGQDVYRVVEAPITSDGGKAILHIDLNTNKYRASVVKEGVLLDFFDNIVFSCENELSGDCTYSLDGTVDPNNDVPIEDITDFSYSVSIDEDNQTVTVLFAVPSGTPSTVNVLLNQIDMFGNLTSCNTTVITSAGSITCDYTDTIEKSILELSISKDGVELAVLSYVNDPELDMDGMNFFIVFLFMISLVGMAISSPEWMVIISVMVLMISGTMLLLSGMSLVMGLGAIAWVIIAASIIIFKMAKQEDR